MTNDYPLPEYHRPPVIEVVCGVQFSPLREFTSSSFGQFWERIRTDYVSTEDKPPLAPIIEQATPYDAEIRIPGPSLMPPLRRVFFVHRIANWLMQLQQDRLLHNWRKIADNDEYPRYPEVIKRFWNAWDEFVAFCRDAKLGPPSVNQLELTYVNHIFESNGWSGLADVGTVFPDISWRPQRTFLPPPESLSWSSSFPLPSREGRLHISVKHGIQKTDNRSVLLCESTARGVPRVIAPDALRAWFDVARTSIVRGFEDITAEHIQATVWQKEDQKRV